MPDDPESRVQEVFADAVALNGPELDRYLDSACAGNATLRRTIDRLLRAHRRSGRFLAAPAVPTGLTDAFSGNLSGRHIGDYVLHELLGEGGFAAVYRAEQHLPVRREVALKIIKVGMDTEQVVARFNAERQALAILEHPNIAKVFDAGTTDGGRPFFVMELVRGVSITEFCDRRRLSARQRLELFVPVCRAVQHAHQKGIIHRDLKPNNVLVTEVDGTPVPKVIDIGISKATQSTLAERTLFTTQGQWIGTPAYMSPEQARLDPTDVDTRSDIYSMGVLLYELLTGTTPIESTTLRAAAYDQMHRMIRELDPPAPSARLRSMGDSLAPIAAVRSVGPRELGRAVRGEVDWIVMKCLAKDPNRRYESAGALSADISMHLSGDVVSAGPPDRLYRLRKFVRRHVIAIGVASILLMTIIAALAVSLVSLASAERARRLAEAANQNATDVSNYTLQVYADDKGEKYVRDAYQRLVDAYGPDHRLSVIAQRNLGDFLINHKNFSEGEPMLRDSLARARRVFGPESEEAATNAAQLIICLHTQGKFDETLHLARELHAIALKPDLRRDLRVTFCSWLGGELTVLHRYTEARQPLLQAEQNLRENDSVNWTRRGVMLNLAEGYEAEGNDVEAAAWRRKAAEFSDRFRAGSATRPS